MGGNVSRQGNIFPDVANKAPVRVATVVTSPPIVHSGLYTLNGIALAEGDRVLDKDQADLTLNGIWQASSGNWIRSQDASKNTDLVEGTQVFVNEGTIGAGQMFVLTTTDSPVVIGTSHLTFALRQEVVRPPAYLWNGTSLSFQNPDGTWGAYVNLQGPVGPANNTMFFDTVAQLVAATIPNGITHVYLAGYYNACDGGSKNMISVGGIGADPLQFHTSNGGTKFWQIAEPNRQTPEMCGAKGDNVQDDRPAMQSVENAMSALGGGVVELNPFKTYRNVLNVGVTDLGLIWMPGVTTRFMGARVYLECTGSVYGTRPRSNSHIEGPGTLKTTVSSGPGFSDIYHAPYGPGATVGEVTSVGALGNYLNASNWSIKNLTLDNVRAGGYCIAGIGGISRGVIEDITYPDSALLIGCLNFDWGTVGNVDSSDVAGTRTRYDLGQCYTVHPNNIDVRRLTIGNMTNAASTPIRLSGVHAIRIDEFEIASCNACGVFHTAGDLGYEFALTNAIKRARHTGIVIRNGSILNALAGNAIICNALADNVLAAQSGGYVPYLPPANETDIVFENIRSIGNLSASAGNGIIVSYMEGGTFRNCTIIGHQRGIVAGDAAKRVRFQGGEVNSCYQDGVYLGSGAPPEEITIDGLWSWSNGTGGVYAGIAAANGKRHTITRCRLGNGGESFQDYGVNVSSSCTDVEVSFNHTLGATSVAYQMATTGAFGAIRLFTGNTWDSGNVATPYAGVEIICIEYTLYTTGLRRRCLTNRASMLTTPGSGAWLAGDTIEFTDPAASGFTGSKCVSSGSPGTWKNYGALTA
jgi:hypothetical protein